MTPPPDKQVAGETLEEIAERCVREWVEHDLDEHFESGYDCMIAMKPEDLIERILSALRSLGERCAVIAETCHPQPCTCQTCLIRAEAGAAIRRAIREGK